MFLINILSRFFYAIIFTGTFIIGALFYCINYHRVDFSILYQHHTIPSLLVDDEGVIWGRFQLHKKDPIDNIDLPLHVINAFIAAEDWDFFKHSGISLKGIIRSIIINIYMGRKAQGASTITQQLVKLLFFDSKKTFSRKIKEQLYAILVEMQLSKEQILYTYLNNVYFGCGIYGIEAAAQFFWNKHANELSLNQAATLAGIIRSPARYCPVSYPLASQKRRDIVLGKMLHLNYITQDEYEKEVTEEIDLYLNPHESCAPHVKETLRIQLEQMLGKSALYTGGYTIQTTINMKMQLIAQEIFKKEISRLRQELGKNIDGGLIILDRKSGEIKALVGGFDFAQSRFNRALQAYRQIGSIFKPIIYAAALEEGKTFADTEMDEPLELIHNNTMWRPKNYNKKFSGIITLAHALSHSNNIVAIKTFLKTNQQRVLEIAKKCGIKNISQTYPSLALGCIDATLSEAAGMFNIFANDGIYVEPFLLSSIKDRWGNRMYKTHKKELRIIESVIASQIKSVLSLGISRIKPLYDKQNWIQSEAISKTGTTNDSRTCWFIGSTPSLTTAVYIGTDDNIAMGNNVYPRKTAFPIWKEINCAIQSKEKTFSYDPFLKRIIINEYTGALVKAGEPAAIEILVP